MPKPMTSAHPLDRTSLLGVLLLAALALLPCAAQRADAGDEAMAKRKADLVFRARVGRAIASGARWVASNQAKDGSFRLEGNAQEGPFAQSRHRFGVCTLCTYTLADCNYSPEHPVIKKALGYLRKHYRSQLKGDYWPQASAYSLSLMVLALHTLFVQPATEARAAARDRYGARKRTEKNPCGYPEWARKAIHRTLDWFMKHQAKTGLFRYPGGLHEGTRPKNAFLGDEDLSNTQYVLLAIWAGTRCGYDIKPEQLERIARRLLRYQERLGEGVERVEDPDPEEKKPTKDGSRYAQPTKGGEETERPKDRARGFPYTLRGPITGSMTTAGLSSLLIVKAMLLEQGAVPKALRVPLDKGIWDAIAWLQRNYTISAYPGRGLTWHYYYLYGLERACVIAGKRFLGAHDWYREGGEMLLDSQEAGGRWEPEGQLGTFGRGPAGGSRYRTALLDSCFALLLLKRATLVPKVPVLRKPKVVTTGG
jgi:hypothetical protein